MNIQQGVHKLSVAIMRRISRHTPSVSLVLSSCNGGSEANPTHQDGPPADEKHDDEAPDTKVPCSPPVPYRPDQSDVVPEPETPPCSMCGILVKTSTGTATARLMRHEDYQDRQLVSTTITLWDAAGNTRTVQYDADELPLAPNTCHHITSDDFTNLDGDGSLPVGAYVVMTFQVDSQQVSVPPQDILVRHDTPLPPCNP